MTIPLRSLLPWIGGTYSSAQRILVAFPPPNSYDTSVELCGGAAHVLMQNAPAHHAEVSNEVDGDWVNFWMVCRDQGEAGEEERVGSGTARPAPVSCRVPASNCAIWDSPRCACWKPAPGSLATPAGAHQQSESKGRRISDERTHV